MTDYRIRGSYEKASEKRKEARHERQASGEGHGQQRQAEGREVKRARCKLILAGTSAKNGSNIQNGKHRRAESKRKAKAGAR